MFLHYVFMLLFCIECRSIPPDYYSDRLSEIKEREDYKPENRRTFNFEIKIDNATLRSSYIDSEDDDDNDNLFEVFFTTRKSYRKKHTKKVVTEYITETSIMVENSSDKVNDLKILRQHLVSNNTPKHIVIDILKNYDYVYDDLLKPINQLRVEMGQDFHDISTDKPDNMVGLNSSENAQQLDNNSLKYLAEFFNLEPAAGVFRYSENKEVSIDKDKVWYVPEKYPCWELPVIYGELGRKTKVSEIFLVYFSRLKNVIDENLQKDPAIRKYLIIDAAKVVNKWCAVSPCYGDHTLCLFSRKMYSPLCDKEYKVYTPTMSEQIALVNTVNSMRNSVARGTAQEYPHLPRAANMKQVIYDLDLEEMADVWLRQCLPGVAPCSSLDNQYIMQLECTKYADFCCVQSYKGDPSINCIPEYECFILPVIGCIHAWFLSAGKTLTATDVDCGHAAPDTFNTVQLLWAETYKIGCAFGARSNGDVRVVCNFTPGAPYNIESNYYCGLIAHQDITEQYPVNEKDITDLQYLASLGINLKKVNSTESYSDNHFYKKHVMDGKSANILRTSDLDNLNNIYKTGWIRQKLRDFSNGSKGMIARMVTKYTFHENDASRCDTDEPIYVVGSPGSLCVERSGRFDALCYDFGDPTQGYRLAAILAPLALFSLILYDLFSGVMRQTNF